MKKKYDVFISYRKSNAIIHAQLIYKLLIEHGYEKNRIFFDSHAIHAEHYDQKIKKSVPDSKCLLLFITKNCFEFHNELNEKEEKKDWYIEEIRTALHNNIKIIPLYFDGIKSLEDSDVLSSIEKRFTKEEVEEFIYNQGVRYDDDYTRDSEKKLFEFLPAPESYIDWRVFCFGGVLCLLMFVLFIGMCFTVGLFVGKRADNIGIDEVFDYNTKYISEQDYLFFEYKGYSIKYFVEKDSLGQLTTPLYSLSVNKDNRLVEFFSAMSFGTAVTVMTKNLKSIEYIGRGGKGSKILYVGAAIGIFAGTFVGYCQGYEKGKEIQYQKIFAELPIFLHNRNNWQEKVNMVRRNKKYYNDK